MKYFSKTLILKLKMPCACAPKHLGKLYNKIEVSHHPRVSHLLRVQHFFNCHKVRKCHYYYGVFKGGQHFLTIIKGVMWLSKEKCLIP